jgi:hypothetical protein
VNLDYAATCTRTSSSNLGLTSSWAPDDLLALFALVPPGQFAFGSDTPYGTPLSHAIMTLRCALEAGLTAEQVRSVAGVQLGRLLACEEPLDRLGETGFPDERRIPFAPGVHVVLTGLAVTRAPSVALTHL